MKKQNSMKNPNRLTLGQKMKAIRKALGKTQVSMAIDMGYSDVLVQKYENNRIAVSSDVLSAFRKVAGIEGVPLSDDEISAATKEMISWNNAITYGDKKQVIELHKKFERYIKWTFDLDFENLFDIFCIRYLCMIGKKEEAKKLAASLKERKPTFTDMYLYWYYRYLGLLKHWDWQYKQALTMYLEAEVIGEQLNLNDVMHFYNIGNCLINCGYPYVALDYFGKAEMMGLSLASIKHGFIMQRLVAVCYGSISKTDKALKLLGNCLEYLLNEKKEDKLSICGLYIHTARVYQAAGNYEKAFEHFDRSARYCDEKEELFLECLCYKATFLREYNKNDEVRKCLDKGLPLAAKSTLWYYWLHAIKHSLLLDEAPSREYLISTSILNLNSYGKHTMVMNCYKWLSVYFEKDGKYKKALLYNKEASDISTRLMKGDLSL